MGFNFGINCAEAVNFARPFWINYLNDLKKVKKIYFILLFFSTLFVFIFKCTCGINNTVLDTSVFTIGNKESISYEITKLKKASKVFYAPYRPIKCTFEGKRIKYN